MAIQNTLHCVKAFDNDVVIAAGTIVQAVADSNVRGDGAKIRVNCVSALAALTGNARSSASLIGDSADFGPTRPPLASFEASSSTATISGFCASFNRYGASDAYGPFLGVYSDKDPDGVTGTTPPADSSVVSFMFVYQASGPRSF